MNDEHLEMRKHLAERTRQYQSGHSTWQVLMDELNKAFESYKGDADISNLFDLIEHEPKRGGFLGVNENKWKQYQAEIAKVLVELETKSG